MSRLKHLVVATSDFTRGSKNNKIENNTYMNTIKTKNEKQKEEGATKTTEIRK